MTSISIKPGAWVRRDDFTGWRATSEEPQLGEEMWLGAVGMRLGEHLFDLTSLPTYHEPDWRKTKFQVQAATDTGRLGTCQCCNKNKANSVICQDCIDEHMD